MEKKRVSQKPYLFIYFLIESEWNYIFAIVSVYIYRKQAQCLQLFFLFLCVYIVTRPWPAPQRE